MDNFDYVADVFSAYTDVRAGRKPLLIVSAGKSQFALETLLALADEDGLPWVLRDFRCEDGQPHEHLFVAGEGSPYAREAVNLIMSEMSRPDLQVRLGLLLGYTAAEINEFIESELGKTCPCDCCGGPETVLDDAAKARTYEFGYRF